MKPLIVIILLLHSFSVFSGELEMFSALSSVKKMPFTWDLLYEVEHKEVESYHKTSQCVSKEDLVNNFPKGNRPGRYWDYVDKYQKERNSKIFLLGTIDQVQVFEVVHRFMEPIDYIKILAFEPKGTSLLCPFTVIAEWNRQVVYSKSTITKTGSKDLVVTKLTDNIAHQGPTPWSFVFRFENSLPVKGSN